MATSSMTLQEHLDLIQKLEAEMIQANNDYTKTIAESERLLKIAEEARARWIRARWITQPRIASNF